MPFELELIGDKKKNLIGNQKNIIKENSKEKYKLFMMMNKKKRIK